MSTTTKPRLSGPQIMAEVLEGEGRPMHVRLIAERTLKIDQARKPAERSYRGATPEATMSAALSTSEKKQGPFVKVAPGVFGLRAWPKAKLSKAPAVPEGRRTPAPKAPAKKTSAEADAPKRGASPRGKKNTTAPGKKNPRTAKAPSDKVSTSRSRRPDGVDPDVAAASVVLSEAQPAPASTDAA